MEKEGKQFPALRENIAQFVLFMFASLKNSILERLEVATKSGAQIEFIFEFSLPTCQLIDIGNIENIKEIKGKHQDYNFKKKIVVIYVALSDPGVIWG